MSGGPLERLAVFISMKDPKNLLGFCGLMIAGDVGPYTTYTNRNGKFVFFDRAPPKDPPSTPQLAQRALWLQVSLDWRKQTTAQKATWERISKMTNIVMTGYNLFLAVETTHRGRYYLPTLLRQAGEPAAPPYNIRGPVNSQQQARGQ